MPAAQQFLEGLRESLKKAKVHLEESVSARSGKLTYTGRINGMLLEIRVLLSTANMPVPRNLTRKLSRLYDGPFTVEKVVSDQCI